jgi:hypothetical protein
MTTNDPIIAKIAKRFICTSCNHGCNKQSDFNKHLLTAKHNMMTNTMTTADTTIAKIATAHDCICGKKYAHRQGLNRHKKTCSLITNSVVIPENPESKPSLMDIITQNKEIMDMLVLQNKELMNTIKEIIPKIGSNNNNNNNTTNNQFNLQVFLNEDCKDAMNFSEFIEQFKMSFKDLENQAESGYVKGITKLFIENLQGLGKHKRPIHCTDKKRKTLYIKENDEWDKEGSQDTLKKGIQEITKRTYQTLMKETEERAEEYSDMDSLFSQNWIDIQRNLTPVAPRETSFEKVMSNISENTIIPDNQKTLM